MADAARRVRVRIEEGIARITLDDGKVNALSGEALREVESALDAAEKAEAVVVFRGRPGILSAGFDLATFEKGVEPTLEMLRAGVALIRRFLASPQPILSVCTGHAYPMGAFLLLASDARIAVAGDWRIGMNETAIGLTVPRFAVELARHRLTPPGFARVPTAAMFAPEEAARLGYVDRVTGDERLEGEVAAETARLRSLDRTHFSATKARVNEQVLAAVGAAAEELGAG